MVVCDVEVIRKERVCKKEQMQNREDAKQGLVGGPVRLQTNWFWALYPKASFLLLTKLRSK